jgi:hypothetical protein
MISDIQVYHISSTEYIGIYNATKGLENPQNHNRINHNTSHELVAEPNSKSRFQSDGTEGNNFLRRPNQGRGKGVKSLQPPTTKSSTQQVRGKYAFKHAGWFVTKGGAKLTGWLLNSAPPNTSLVRSVGTRLLIATNVHPDHPTSNETTVFDITSIAEQFKSYGFDETSALMSYKKMMTLHLKDNMFRKLKYITNDTMLEFWMQEISLCG